MRWETLFVKRKAEKPKNRGRDCEMAGEKSKASTSANTSGAQTTRFKLKTAAPDVPRYVQATIGV